MAHTDVSHCSPDWEIHAMTIADAARATRKYWPAPHWEYVSVYYVAFDGPQDPENIGELFYSFEEAQAACDRLNLLAVLESNVFRKPSEMMLDAGDTIAAYGGVSEVWSAMIDALIAEVRKSR